jgi:plasmid stabilization system protein ParE
MEKKPQYKVIVSDRARQMLVGHVFFLAQKSPTATRRVKNALIDAIRSLSTIPKQFPFLNTGFILQNKYHKMFFGKWYLILYQIRDQTVYIDYIVDCRQDYRWLVRQNQKKVNVPIEPAPGHRGVPSYLGAGRFNGGDLRLINVQDLFSGLEVTDNAKDAQIETVNYLTNLGFYCVMEHRVKDRGNGRPGYVDILAKKGDIRLAIEFDHRYPRTKSIYKLKQLDNCQKIILLRGHGTGEADGIEILPINIKNGVST